MDAANRSLLTIDLNEIPSPSETLPSLSPTSLVRSFHDHHPPAEGSPAEIEASPEVSCSGCGGVTPNAAAERLVCDGCERGFHLRCVGVGGAVEMVDEWICGECVRDGVRSRRWSLGRRKEGGVRLIDMNASPPSDGDNDGGGWGKELKELRKSSLDDNFCGYISGNPLPYSNIIYPVNGFGLNKAPALVTHTLRLDFQDILHQRRSTARSFEDITYSSQLGRIKNSNTTFRLPPWNPGEVLQSLKEFISERQGILEEGWHVEFKQSKNGCESYAVYCAPDGKMFETMSDVACYLGLASTGNSVEPETKNVDVLSLRRNGVHVPKRRKLTRLPTGNGFTETRNSLMNGFNNGFTSNLQGEQFSASKPAKKLEIAQSLQEENGTNDFHQFHDGLPLQYEDFFVLSLGKVDVRASYHDAGQIWPVGYRSCWHDKITGSLFLCDVLDGGDTGPIFKVRRFSCSALPIPYGSTVLHRRSCPQVDCANIEEGHKVTDSNEESCIEMYLSDPSFPVEGDILSWLLSGPDEVDGQKSSHQQLKIHSSCERSQDLLGNNIPLGEKIGEFSVDGSSSSLVWNILSHKLADTCHQIFKQTGSLKFFCKHVKDGMPSFYDVMNDKNKDLFSSLDKFCSLLGSLKIPYVVTSDDEHAITVEALKNWMSIDRFGLDTEFVQELLEQCPEVNRCSRYESLKRRNVFSSLPLVANGFFLINGRCFEEFRQESIFDGLYREYKANREPAIDAPCRPPGKHLGMELPPHLVGNVLQVWELLCRFNEILGLDPLNFGELEAELMRPWFESLSKLNPGVEDSPADEIVSVDGSCALSEQASSSSSEIDRPEQNKFIEVGNAKIGGVDTSLALPVHSKCACMSLQRAHISLLDVLVSELQIKVAALVDPSIDGESKSRRGRRRDVDSSILAIKPKLNLLPINELTWPELARRYILAVISVDGNLDSVETGRECGKLFRCLQGDGGVLCGSLVGVAGIEADALLLAEAMKRIYGSLNSENNILVLEDDDPEAVSTSGGTEVMDGKLPAWALALEPVKKLPTNVGTRIRKCVHEALAKDPPDWARKILEHSISKEVYKGNASGPTKKAVLAVLADVNEGSQQKAHVETKKKTTVSILEIIMKKCRIILRRAAASDEEKVFCNLLGRNLLNSSENDEEGLLGSPAMASRSLDFRTIDLRLAIGTYGGSHEAFLEDVRELWKIILIAHAEQPDLVQLAETLSQKFESLYEEEVAALAQKLKEYSQMEKISSETKKDIEEIVTSTCEIPKAPWDEGVCKVCGIDKDDDSVLLCDTCDAEYHTYCLNPPLARIPEGNWYCPSCVSGVNILGSTSKGAQFGQRHRRKYHGEGIHFYLEELGRLAAVLEQKEFWEFSVEERISLLKFLCDEVLNSILIRQHLEQCAEASADLQQKLRLLYSEWKNLKLREDVLSSKAARLGLTVPDVAGHINVEGHINELTNNSIGTGLQPSVSERCDRSTCISDNAPQQGTDASHATNQNGGHDIIVLEKNVSGNKEVKSIDSECEVEDAKVVHDDIVSPEKNVNYGKLSKRRKISSHRDSSMSNPQPHEVSGLDTESSCQVKMQEHGRLDASPMCKSADLQGASVSSSCVNSVAAENIPSSSPSEVQTCNMDLSALQKDISSLQQSIASAESQLLKSSVRMEFLGSDSSGRLYWVSVQSGGPPWVIVDGAMALQPRSQGIVDANIVREGSFFENPAYVSDGLLGFEGSSAACPFVRTKQCSAPSCSPWVYYESDSEIRELVKSLKDSHPKERELKDSILHWLKLRYHEIHQTGNQEQMLSVSTNKNDVPSLLVTKASTMLEHKYGPYVQSDKVDPLKKRMKRSRKANDEKIYRCQCMEPVWPSRYHCISCHITFFTTEELSKHNDDNCRSKIFVSGKRKSNDEPSVKKSETCQLTMEINSVEASRSAGSDVSKLIKFQDESTCPYKFEEICSKFITDDSIKELVHGIGLIGSEGTPAIVPSLSPYLGDPALVFHPQNNGVTGDVCKLNEKTVDNGDQVTGRGNTDKTADASQRFQENKNFENVDTGQSSLGVQEGTDKFPNAAGFMSPEDIEPCCTVPESSLRPLVGRGDQVLRQLKMILLEMEAALPEEAIKASKIGFERRRAWHNFVKGAETIFEMVQATIVLEDMIKMEYLKNEWWYWSSLSAAAKTSTLSSLALRISALDNAIAYEKIESDPNPSGSSKPSGEQTDQQTQSIFDSSEKFRITRRSSKRRKEAEG